MAKLLFLLRSLRIPGVTMAATRSMRGTSAWNRSSSCCRTLNLHPAGRVWRGMCTCESNEKCSWPRPAGTAERTESLPRSMLEWQQEAGDSAASRLARRRSSLESSEPARPAALRRHRSQTGGPRPPPRSSAGRSPCSPREKQHSSAAIPTSQVSRTRDGWPVSPQPCPSPVRFSSRQVNLPLVCQRLECVECPIRWVAPLLSSHFLSVAY